MERRPRGRPKQFDGGLVKVQFDSKTRIWIRQLADLCGKSEAAVVRHLVEQFKATLEDAERKV